jgi:hypothetical protein
MYEAIRAFPGGWWGIWLLLVIFSASWEITSWYKNRE